MKKKILYALLGFIIVAQFIRPSHTNPAIDASLDFQNVANPPAEVLDLLKKACYDCHSYETEYPWYSNIAPVSWWLSNHINEGREELNFSLFGRYSGEDKGKQLRKCGRQISKKEMPLPSFTWFGLHPEANLTDAQRATLADWFKANGGEPSEKEKKWMEEHHD